jgi:hypothetical protein
MDTYPTLRSHLAGLLARFEEADQRARAEHDPDARADAEAEALEATGDLQWQLPSGYVGGAFQNAGPWPGQQDALLDL